MGGMDRPAGMPFEVFYDGKPWTKEADDAHQRSIADAGSRSALDVAARVDANELERETIKRFERLVRGGYKFVNITVRKDGRETTFEGDWLVRLFR